MATSNADLQITGKGEMADILRSFAGVGLQLQKMQDRLDGVEKKAKRASSEISAGFKRMGNTIQRNVKRVAVVFGAGFVGAMTKGVKSAADFEKSLAKVSTLLSGDVAKQIGVFKKSILDLSKTTGENVNVLSDSLFTIISATVKGSESVAGANELLAATSKLAVSGFTDAATATEALTTVLNSYNLSTKDAVTVSDKLTKIAALANTTFGEMAPQLGKVASIMAAAGVDIDEFGFMFASLTAGGRQVNMAMTDMRAIINGLTKPSKALTKIYEEAGIKSGAVAIKQMGVVKVLELIKEKTGGTFEEIQKVIEQQEAWAGASILLGERLDDAGKVVEQIGDSAGATEVAYQKMAATFSFQSNVFKQKINAVLIEVGEKILPFLITKLNEMSKWVQENSDEIVDFFTEAFEAFVAFGEFILKHGKKIAVTLGLIWATASIIKFVEWARESTIAIGALKFMMAAFPAILAAMKAGWVALNMVMKANPIFLVATAFTAVGAAIVMLIKNWKELVAFFDKTPKLMSDQLRAMAKVLKDQPDIVREEAYKRFENDPRLQRRLGKEGARAKAAELKNRTELLRIAEGIESSATKTKREVNAKFNNLMKNMFKGGAFEVDVPGAGAGDKDKPDEKLVKAMVAARVAALKRIRVLEIAAMEEIAAIEAKLEDAVAAIRASKLTTVKQKEDEIALLRVQAEKQIGAVEDKQLDKIVKIEEQASADRMAAEEDIRKIAIKKAKEDLAAARTAFEIRQEAAREEIRIAEENAAKRLASIEKWRDIVLGALKGAGVAVLGEMENLFGGIFSKVKEQLRQVIKLAIAAAGEGENLLILTDEERARLEQERGRALTGSEARQLATAMSPQQLANLQSQGRIGGFEQVGVETPANRMQVVLDKMVSFWENLSQNLGPILDWLMDTAVPGLIDAFLKNIPKIVKTLNANFKQMVPFIIDQIPVILDAILTELPGIVESIIEGILAGIQRLFERLPEIAAPIMRFLTENTLSLIDMIGTIIFDAIPTFIGELIAQTPALIIAIVENLFKELLPGLVSALAGAIRKAITGGPTDSAGGDIALGVLSGGISSFFHDGGMIGEAGRNLAGAIRAHQGLFLSPSLAAGEVPIIAQTGEAVLNRQAVADQGGEAGINAMNRGEQVQHVVNNIINTGILFPDAAADTVDRLQEGMLRRGVGSVNAALRRNKVAGFKSKV